MQSLSKEIFGKSFRFVFSDEKSEILAESIGLYPDSIVETPDVIVQITSDTKQAELVGRNPAIFTKTVNAIVTEFPQCTVSWESSANAPLKCSLSTQTYKSNLKAVYSKFRSMEYSTEVEMFEQVLHELVLIPAVYFFSDLSLIHAATLSLNGEAILLAGTGGTGKTSAMLALRKSKGLSFVSDDMAVVSRDGYVYPNLAWPKVYGYNLSDYITREELLHGRRLLDKLQFGFRMRRNPKTVRRKVRPDRLYPSFEKGKIPIGKVIYLFRDNATSIRQAPLVLNDAVQMGLHVMKTEYSGFHNFMEWDAYNSIAKHVHPLLNTEAVFKNWENNLMASFRNVNFKLLHIPVKILHADYLNYMNKLVSGGKYE